MTRDEIIDMAVECFLISPQQDKGIYFDSLLRFADLVAAAEREECANMSDMPIDEIQVTDDCSETLYRECDCADLIRERK